MALDLQRAGGGSSHAKKPLVKALAINGPRLQRCFSRMATDGAVLPTIAYRTVNRQPFTTGDWLGSGSDGLERRSPGPQFERPCGVLSEFHALRRKQ